MWFKNLQLFRLEQPWTLPPGSLEQRLAERPLVPCSAMATQSAGWVPLQDGGPLVVGFERHLLIALGTEQKLLPSSVINEAAKEKAVLWEKSRGFKPGRKMMREFKEQAASELLPRAFSRRRSARAWIDPVGQRIVVESASAGQAETVIEQLRETIGELPVVPLEGDPSPALTMTEWLSKGRADGGFSLEDECELSSGAVTKSVVRFLRHPLDSPKVQQHLQEGFQVTRLGLNWNERISLVVNEKLQLKRVTFLDMEAEDKLDQSQDPLAQLEANFALMAGEYGSLLRDLEAAFGCKPTT